MCPLNTERCGRTTEINKERNETGVLSHASNPRSVENEKKIKKRKRRKKIGEIRRGGDCFSFSQN